MKTPRLFAPLVIALFSSSLTTEATVIIYKGTSNMVRGNGVSKRTVPTTLFFVVDFNTLGGSFVFAQNIAGVKSIYDDGNRAYGTAIIGPGATPLVAYTSADGQYANATNFQFRGIRMKGVRSKVRLAATDPVPATIPKTVTGTYSFSSGNPILIDGGFALTVDLKRTQFANANNLTVQQAVGTVITEYISKKGYVNTLPTP